MAGSSGVATVLLLFAFFGAGAVVVVAQECPMATACKIQNGDGSFVSASISSTTTSINILIQ
jgi:O-glycosyl hydrolase